LQEQICSVAAAAVCPVRAVPRVHRRKFRQRPEPQPGDARQGGARRNSRPGDVVHEEVRRQAESSALRGRRSAALVHCSQRLCAQMKLIIALSAAVENDGRNIPRRVENATAGKKDGANVRARPIF